MGYTLNSLFQLLYDSTLVLDVIFFHLSLSALFSCKVSRTRYYLALIAVYGLSVLTEHHVPYAALSIAAVFAIHFLASRILYTGKLWHHAAAAATALAASLLLEMAIEYSVCFLLGISHAELNWHTLLYAMTSLVGKSLAILLAWILFQLRRNRDAGHTQLRWVILSLLLPAVSYSMLVVVFDAYLSEKGGFPAELLVYTCLLAVANVVNLYLIHTMAKNEKEAREASLLRQQTEIQTESILALEKNHRAQRKSVHEYKHQLQTIHDLLESGQNDSALAYVKQLQRTQTTRILAVNSHHPIIDAILNHKYQLAKDHQIDVQLQVNDLSAVALSADSLVVLLTNLWDNAIEACCRVSKDRCIECNLVAKDSLFLSIRNTSLPVTISGGQIPTSKEPKHDHGFGLIRIQHILDQFGAEYTYTYEEGWFQFVAEIPLNKH